MDEAWIKVLDQGASDGEEEDAATAGVALSADAIPTSPGSLADLTSGGWDRLVAHTGKVQREEYLEDECETRRNFIEVDGYYYATSDYFGDQWVATIVSHRQSTAITPAVADHNTQYKLHNVEAMPIPDHMSYQPYSYQLEGAAQADMLCKGVFKGMISEDGTGVSKTLLAIQTLSLINYDPGFSFVVASKSLWA